MKAKNKVLKVRPSAFCDRHPLNIDYLGYVIKVGNEGCMVCLSQVQKRQSWAWADAYRNLTKKY